MASILKQVISALFMDRDCPVGNTVIQDDLNSDQLRGVLWTRSINIPGGRPLDIPRQTIVDEQTGSLIAVVPSGTLEVGELIRLTGGNFETGALLPNLWQTNFVNGGTGTVVDGELVVSTNTTADGASFIQSVNRARFITATFNRAHLAIQMPGRLNTDVIRRWGAYDPVTPLVSGDGIFFENASGQIKVVRRRGGAEVETVLLEDFNGNKIPGTDIIFVEDGDVHVYEIVYNAGAILFFQDRRLVHRMSSLTSVAYDTVHLALGLEVQNINGNIINNTLKSRGFSISRVGTQTANPDKFLINASGTATLKNSPGTLRSIIILDTGVGGATLEIFDALDNTGTPLFVLDLTAELITLNFGFDFNIGLTYDASGASFEVMVIFD